MMKIITSLALFLVTLGINSQTTTKEILIKNGEIELPGTLSYTKENQPLIIWISGSGNIDRNGNQLPMVNANYIKQFRDEITAEGFAFFSYDKRTANQKNKKLLKGIIFDDFVEDAKAVINHLKKGNKFSKITLVGHSQGSLVAMLAADSGINKIISIAGPGSPIDKVMVKQLSKQNPSVANTAKKYFEELRKTGSIKKVSPMLYGIFSPQNQKFISNWMSYDPASVINKLTIPIAIIQGGKDLQANKEDALKLHNKNPKAHLFMIENMNHVLKTIKKDENNQKSYFTPEFPISKKLITTVKKYINEY